jgi:hypothetical protein
MIRRESLARGAKLAVAAALPPLPAFAAKLARFSMVGVAGCQPAETQS